MNLNSKKPEKRPLYVYYIIAVVIIVLLNVFALPALSERSVKETDYTTFLKAVDRGKVYEATINSDYIYYTMKVDGNDVYCKTVSVEDQDLVSHLYDAGVSIEGTAPQRQSLLLSLILGYVLPIAIFILLGRWLSKKMMSSMGNGGPGGMMSFGKSNAKVYVKSSTGIKFSDVAGEDEAKELLTEIVDFLHNPEKYREIGASMPKGALLVGPPGTGKTLLAKAVAGEAEVPFFSISGSEFVEMFVGMGAAKVRDLFKQANEKAPCIVFIDEIDTIGKKRDGSGMGGGNDEREQTLNQLLTEMDGFDGSKGVVILAATNRPDSLDPALLRPGRFDRRIPVELPDLQGREEILKVHAKKIKIADTVRFDEIAKAAVGASGAELANIVNEAALRAVRDGRKFATQADFEESIEVVIAGYQKKNRVLSNKEKLIVSYLPEGPKYFPDDMMTDQPERQICAEIIREKALLHLREEVPHGIGVEMMAINKLSDNLTEIHATIYCERASHKGIIIGKQGAMLRTIGAEARRDIENLLGTKVNLQLWVKVREDWRNRMDDLRTLGYESN